MNKLTEYYTKVTVLESGNKNHWNYNLIEIFKGGEKIGEYKRNYASYAKETFYPFTLNNKDYALYSDNYMYINLMTLPDCETIDLKDECKKQLHGYCPTDIYVPAYGKGFYTYNNEEKPFYFCIDPLDSESDLKEAQEVGYSNIGFALGCYWGDDSSWKLNLLDLSKIEEKELWFVNNQKERKTLYEDWPNGLSLKKLECDFDEGKLEYYYQLTQKYISL